MNLFERIKIHWFGGVITLAAICISTTWVAINEVLVRPRDFEIEKRAQEISNLQEGLRELKALLASSKEVDLQKEVHDLKMQITNSSKEVSDLHTLLANSSKQVDYLQMQLINSSKQVTPQYAGAKITVGNIGNNSVAVVGSHNSTVMVR